MISKIKKAWVFIVEGGTRGKNDSDSAITRSYNKMAFLTGSGSLLMFFIGFATNRHLYFFAFTIGLAAFYYSLVLFNHFNRVYLGRLVTSLFGPLWIFALQVCFGGFFSQSMAIFVCSAITYISFREQKLLRNSLIIYTFVLYFLALLSFNLYGELLFAWGMPGDDLIIFYIGMGWIGMVIKAFDDNKTELLERLREKNQRLEQTTEELEKFTYVASHDLKSPLRTITGFISLIERDLKKEKYENLEERFSYVKTGAEQMNVLIQDILELSHLNHGMNDKLLTSVNFNSVLDKVRFALQEDLSNSNAEISSEELPSYFGHEAEFALLFQNIIQNGIKYNESEHPSVKITSETVGDDLLIKFTDNGIGVPEDYRERIFELFSRLHNSHEYQGTGLGLGLCKKIIRKYQGTIGVEDNPEGGSIFIVALPRQAASIA